MIADETHRPKTRPLISRLFAVTATLALLLTLGNIQNPATAKATENGGPYLCQNISESSKLSKNVHAPTAGGVDVTPLAAEKLENGDVKYKFQVSLLGLYSSPLPTGRQQTADTFQIAMPPFAKDVKFSQYGTYKSAATPKEYNSSAILNSHVTSYIDEDAPGKPTVTAEMPLEIIQGTTAKPLKKQLDEAEKLRTKAVADYYNAHQDKDKAEQEKDVKAFGQAVTLNGMKALRAAGRKAIPGGVVYAGYDYSKFESTVKTAEKLAELEKTKGNEPKVKSYLISTGQAIQALGFHVEYTAPADQVKKTPTMPLWAALAWRSFSEGYHFDATEDGSQNLYEYGVTNPSFNAIADPSTIQKNDFDKNGLYGTNVGITAYTGSWYTIGSDITPGTFNYARKFNLSENPSRTYYAPLAEDHRDIAALNPDKQLPEGRPEARIPEGGRFLNCPVGDHLISYGGGVDVSPILEPLAREPFPENAEGAEGAAVSSPDGKTTETSEGTAESTAEPKCVKPEDLFGTVKTPETAGTPDKTEAAEDGKAHYSFLVSLQAIQSSGHIQTGNTFDIELPFAAQDIKFHQIGAYDTSKGYELGDYKANLKTAHYAKFPLEIMKVDKAAKPSAELDKKYKARAEILKKYSKAQGKTLSDKDAMDQVTQFGMLANQAELKALKDAGAKELPGGIFDSGIYIDKFGGRANFGDDSSSKTPGNTADKGHHDKSHGFLISVNNATRPLAVQVDFTIPMDQAKKTPNMAVWAALAWRGFTEGLPSHEEGAQLLYDIASAEQDYSYLTNPHLIGDDQFDQNGLYGTSTALNQYTGKWWEIGQDITQGTFSYSDAFKLHENESVTYDVAAHDDYRDIAAMHYLEPKPANEGEQPKLCPPEKTNPGGGEATPPAPNPGGGEATPPAPNPGGGEATPPAPTPAPKADEPSASPSPETPDNTGLPKTGVNLTFGVSLAAVLLLAGVVLVGRRRKNSI